MYKFEVVEVRFPLPTPVAEHPTGPGSSPLFLDQEDLSLKNFQYSLVLIILNIVKYP